MMPIPVFFKSAVFFILAILILPINTAYSSSIQSVPTAWDRIMEEETIRNVAYGYSFLYGGEYSKAAVEFKSALQKNPNNVHARLGYGSALYWLGDIDRAYNEFEQALKTDSQNADAYQLRGIIKAGRGQYDDALEDFKKAAKLNPGRGDVRMNMGSVYSVYQFKNNKYYNKCFFYWR